MFAAPAIMAPNDLGGLTLQIVDSEVISSGGDSGHLSGDSNHSNESTNSGSLVSNDGGGSSMSNSGSLVSGSSSLTSDSTNYDAAGLGGGLLASAAINSPPPSNAIVFDDFGSLDDAFTAARPAGDVTPAPDDDFGGAGGFDGK